MHVDALQVYEKVWRARVQAWICHKGVKSDVVLKITLQGISWLLLVCETHKNLFLRNSSLSKVVSGFNSVRPTVVKVFREKRPYWESCKLNPYNFKLQYTIQAFLICTTEVLNKNIFDCSCAWLFEVTRVSIHVNCCLVQRRCWLASHTSCVCTRSLSSEDPIKSTFVNFLVPSYDCEVLIFLMPWKVMWVTLNLVYTANEPKGTCPWHG